ncbi:hypothetical protein GF406_01165 [candidate division KSB1 bacterium]|nr:hypothetical protein [candidate division KSB1 bacterium]
MIRKINLFCIFSLIAFNAHSQMFKTVSVEYTRTTKQKESEEMIKGHIYYDGNKTIVITKEPVNQRMVLENNIILIYYADEKRAIRIKSQNPVTLPFFQSFIGLVDENLGLAKLGYTIDKNELHGDTLFVYWKPPKNAEKLLGEFILALKNNRIVLTKSKAPDGKTMIQTSYNNYIKHDNQFFPLKIKSVLYSEKNITTESIIYNNPIFNAPLSKQISQFELPDNIKVKEVEW